MLNLLRNPQPFWRFIPYSHTPYNVMNLEMCRRYLMRAWHCNTKLCHTCLTHVQCGKVRNRGSWVVNTEVAKCCKKSSLGLPLVVGEGANPVRSTLPVHSSMLLGVVTDGIHCFTERSSPVVADKPAHPAWTCKFCIGALRPLGEWLHQVGTNVIHGAISNEGLKKGE